MEIDASATYHVERSGDGGRDLAVVFGRVQAPATVMLAPQEVPGGAVEPEPPISMEQAIANAAAITSPAAGPVTTLVAKPEVVTPAAPAPAPAPSSRSNAPAPANPVDPMSALNLVGPPAPRKSEYVAAPRPSPLVAPPAAQASTQQATIPVPPATSVAPPVTAAAPPAPQPQATLQQQPVPSRPLVTAQTPAPQTPTTPSGGQPVPGQADKKYTGHPISMDFQGVDLRAVLRAFAEPSGLNFIIDPDVQGSVDMVLTEVPWDQALEVILRANQLDYTVDGTIVRIARIETLKRENDSRQALAKSVADAGSLQVRTFSLSYARASSAAPLIKKAALSPRGDVQTDDRTNTLIITDLPAKLDMAANLISTIDRAEPQVEVEARIVQTSRRLRARHRRAVGTQWAGDARSRQHDEPRIPEPRHARRPPRHPVAGRSARDESRADGQRHQHGRARRLDRHRPRARGGERRLQPRRRALGPRADRQGSRPLDAAPDDAEQHRGGGRAGHSDSDSDRRQQHRHRVVQGRGARAEGHAADYGSQHRDHAASPSRTRRPISAAR